MVKVNFTTPSILGREWKTPYVDKEYVDHLVKKHNFSELAASILSIRGIPAEQMGYHLTPSIKDLMPDPNYLMGMEKSVARIFRALKKSENILILSDTSSDGVLSASLLRSFFSDLGYPICSDVYKNEEINVQSKGIDLIIMLNVHPPRKSLKYIEELGTNVIIVDHHTTQEENCPAFSFINPFRPGQQHFGKENTVYANATVLAFMMSILVYRSLANTDLYYSFGQLSSLSYLDYVALSLISDQLPSKKLNRVFIKEGFNLLQSAPRKGFQTFLKKCRIDYVSAYFLSPLLTILNLLSCAKGNPFLLSLFLTNKSTTYIDKLSPEIDKEIEKITPSYKDNLKKCVSAYEKALTQKGKIAIVQCPDLDFALVETITLALKDLNDKSILFLSQKNTEYEGYIKTSEDIDASSLLNKALHKGVILETQNHINAGYFRMDPAHIESFTFFLKQELKGLVNSNNSTLKVDALVPVWTLNRKLIAQFKRLEPHGSGNGAPLLCFANLRVIKAVMKKSGIHCLLQDDRKNRLEAKAPYALKFSSLGKKLLSIKPTEKLHFILSINLMKGAAEGSANSGDNYKISFGIKDAMAGSTTIPEEEENEKKEINE